MKGLLLLAAVAMPYLTPGDITRVRTGFLASMKVEVGQAMICQNFSEAGWHAFAWQPGDPPSNCYAVNSATFGEDVSFRLVPETRITN